MTVHQPRKVWRFSFVRFIGWIALLTDTVEKFMSTQEKLIARHGG